MSVFYKKMEKQSHTNSTSLAETTKSFLKLGDKTYPLNSGINVIGRDARSVINDNNLNLDDHHAIITIIDDHTQYISDFKSSSGTSINSQQLIPFKLYQLCDGSKIKCGDVDIIYNTISQDAGITSETLPQDITIDIHDAPTQFMDFEVDEAKADIHELPTQIIPFNNPDILDVGTKIDYSIIDNKQGGMEKGDDSSNDSVDFMTMQKAVDALQAKQNSIHVSNEQHSPVQPVNKHIDNPLDSDSEEVTELISCSQIHPVKKRVKNPLDSDTESSLTDCAAPHDDSTDVEDLNEPIVTNNETAPIIDQKLDITSDHSDGSVLKDPLLSTAKNISKYHISDSEADSDNDADFIPCTLDTSGVKPLEIADSFQDSFRLELSECMPLKDSSLVDSDQKSLSLDPANISNSPGITALNKNESDDSTEEYMENVDYLHLQLIKNSGSDLCTKDIKETSEKDVPVEPSDLKPTTLHTNNVQSTSNIKEKTPDNISEQPSEAPELSNSDSIKIESVDGKVQAAQDSNLSASETAKNHLHNESGENQIDSLDKSEDNVVFVQPSLPPSHPTNKISSPQAHSSKVSNPSLEGNEDNDDDEVEDRLQMLFASQRNFSCSQLVNILADGDVLSHTNDSSITNIKLTRSKQSKKMSSTVLNDRRDIINNSINETEVVTVSHLSRDQTCPKNLTRGSDNDEHDLEDQLQMMFATQREKLTESDLVNILNVSAESNKDSEGGVNVSVSNNNETPNEREDKEIIIKDREHQAKSDEEGDTTGNNNVAKSKKGVRESRRLKNSNDQIDLVENQKQTNTKRTREKTTVEVDPAKSNSVQSGNTEVNNKENSVDSKSNSNHSESSSETDATENKEVIKRKRTFKTTKDPPPRSPHNTRKEKNTVTTSKMSLRGTKSQASIGLNKASNDKNTAVTSRMSLRGKSTTSEINGSDFGSDIESNASSNSEASKEKMPKFEDIAATVSTPRKRTSARNHLVANPEPKDSPSRRISLRNRHINQDEEAKISRNVDKKDEECRVESKQIPLKKRRITEEEPTNDNDHNKSEVSSSNTVLSNKNIIKDIKTGKTPSVQAETNDPVDLFGIRARNAAVKSILVDNTTSEESSQDSTKSKNETKSKTTRKTRSMQLVDDDMKITVPRNRTRTTINPTPLEITLNTEALTKRIVTKRGKKAETPLTSLNENEVHMTSLSSSEGTSNKPVPRGRKLSANSRRLKALQEKEEPPAEVVINKRRKTSVLSDETSLSNASNNSGMLSTPERTRRKLKPKVVFTLLDSPELESLIRQLGGSVVDRVESCTVLVTEQVKRTCKLLSAIGQAKPICSPKWLTECKKASAFLDPWDYVLVDKEAEKKWDFSLLESLKRSVDRKLMADYTFYFLVNSAADVMKGAIESCKGKVVTKMPAKVNIDRFVVVASPENKAKCNKIVKSHPGIKVVEPEAIFDGTLRQELRLERHLLSV